MARRSGADVEADTSYTYYYQSTGSPLETRRSQADAGGRPSADSVPRPSAAALWRRGHWSPSASVSVSASAARESSASEPAGGSPGASRARE